MNKLISYISLALAKRHSVDKYERLLIKLEIDDCIKNNKIYRVMEFIKTGYELTVSQKLIMEQLYIKDPTRMMDYKASPKSVVLSLFALDAPRRLDYLCQNINVKKSSGVFESKARRVLEDSNCLSYIIEVVNPFVLEQSNKPEFIKELFLYLNQNLTKDNIGSMMSVYRSFKENFEKVIDKDSMSVFSSKVIKMNDYWLEELGGKKPVDQLLQNAKRIFSPVEPLVLTDDLESEVIYKIRKIEESIHKTLSGPSSPDDKSRLMVILKHTLPDILKDYLVIEPRFRKTKLTNNKSAYDIVCTSLDLIESSSLGLSEKINKTRLDNLNKTLEVNQKAISI